MRSDDQSWRGRGRGMRVEARALSARLTGLLRDAYSPPDDPRYWDDLQARIMARVQPGLAAARVSAGVRAGWGMAFSAWARAGLAAACLAAVAAGIAAWHSRTTEARVAYETVLGGPAAVPTLNATRFINVSEQEATEVYVISH